MYVVYNFTYLEGSNRKTENCIGQSEFNDSLGNLVDSCLSQRNIDPGVMYAIILELDVCGRRMATNLKPPWTKK